MIENFLKLKECGSLEIYKKQKKVYQDLIKEFTSKDLTKNSVVINLDEMGINHMMNCGKNCSKYFINFVNNNSCNHHILPRPKKHREYHRFA